MKNPVLRTNIFVAALASLLLGHAAQAATIGSYQAAITIQNESALGDIIGFLTGWSCTASTHVYYTETIPDHKGVPKAVTRAASGKWSPNAAFGEPGAMLSFERNFSAANPAVKVSLENSCERSYSKWDSCAKRDSERKCVGDFVSAKQTALYGWRCMYTQLPEGINQSVEQDCEPYTQDWNYSLSGSLMQNLKQKHIRAALTLLKVREETFATNCTGSPDEKAYIIEMSQGVGGHMGEDDFEFTIRMNGRDYPLKTSEGLVLSDIRYCAQPGQTIADLRITAVERDMVWDDEYDTEPFDLPLVDGATINVRFKRDAYFSKVFKPTLSDLKLKVRAVSDKNW